MTQFRRAVLATAKMVIPTKAISGNEGAARAITSASGPGEAASSRQGTTDTAVIAIAM
jgi:hypothetical protein